MKPLRLLTIYCVFFISTVTVAQVSKDAAVQLEVTLSTAPAAITLQWPADQNALSYTVYRRNLGEVNWGAARKALAKTATSYKDSTVSVGKVYEYSVKKSLKVGTTSITAYGYTESAINRLPVINRGKMILLVDNSFKDVLEPELGRLEEDLWNEGWQVIRHNIPRDMAVPDVKKIITDDENADPINTKALFLFGHIPVPYSGFLNPDGHPNHYGAWPADAYYGEFDNGDWTDDGKAAYNDSIVVYRPDPTNQPNRYDTAIVRDQNRNVPGDGKFDFIQIPSTIYLMIGRVDLSNMLWNGKSEKDLLKQYLNKDHAFRTGTLTAPVRALLEDSFGYFGGEAFAASGWRFMSPLVGSNNIKEITGATDDERRIKWLGDLDTNAYLWTYACGGGWDNGAGGAGSTSELANQSVKGIFTAMFGSYFGDWNTGSNFLRAPLATDYGLSCAWSGRPWWHFFPMGLGEPLGFCAQLTQNNSGDYVTSGSGISNWVHVGLMGDPTLLLHPIVPPTGLAANPNTEKTNVLLSWNPSSDKNILGYNIYRSSSSRDTLLLLNPSPILGTTFTDLNPLSDTNAYYVRAIKLETTPSGSYFNLSPGTRAVVSGMIKGGVATQTSGDDRLQVFSTLRGYEIVLKKIDISNTRIELYDLTGKVVHLFDDRVLSPGVYRYVWSSESATKGIYMLRVVGKNEVLTAKIIVVK